MSTLEAPIGAARRHGATIWGRVLKRASLGAAIGGIGLLIGGLIGPAWQQASAAEPVYKASTSRAARDEAIRSIPRDKLAAEAKAKVSEVVDHPSIFRRLPVQVVDCEPELFHYLVRNPEIVVNIWQLMGLTQVGMDRLDEDHFRCSDGDGTTARAEFVYRDHDTHIIYAEGLYDGPLLPRPVRGNCVVVLKTASVRETDGRYYVTARLDTFMRVDNAGVELVAKLVQGWVGRTVDHNFGETIGFLGSMSRTAETNPQGMRRLAAKLNDVDESKRLGLVSITDQVGPRLAAVRSPQLAAARTASAVQPVVPAAQAAVTSTTDSPPQTHFQPDVLRVRQVAQ